jgi:hypothetical protein
MEPHRSAPFHLGLIRKNLFLISEDKLEFDKSNSAKKLRGKKEIKRRMQARCSSACLHFQLFG